MIGHVIIESIGYPGKAAFLQQPARPDAFRPATEKALRRLATSFGNGSNAAIKIGGFRFTRRVIRLRAPKPAMGGGFMAAPGYLGSEGGRPFNSAAAHQEGGGNGVTIQRIEHPPETCARAISENLFLAHVAHTRGDDADYLAHAFALGEARISITISIGMVVPDTAATSLSAQDVMNAADKALYAAKKAGRNRVVVM